ncbi:MAG: hypothetical protein WD046_07045 [Paracoccaceae bacterium]
MSMSPGQLIPIFVSFGVLLPLAAHAELPADTRCIAGETVLVSEGSATPSDEYSDEVLITLIERDGTEIALSEAAFFALPQYAIATENEYLEGLNCYEGPLGRDVVALLDGEPEAFVALTAMNDYRVEAPFAHLLEFDVIFTTSVNNARLSLRDKGPIWVVYPQSDNAILQDTFYGTYMIWQLIKVELD